MNKYSKLRDCQYRKQFFPFFNMHEGWVQGRAVVLGERGSYQITNKRNIKNINKY